MLTKTERRKIALRNLRKAWAAKGVRKNMRKTRRPYPVYSSVMPAHKLEPTGKIIRNMCEKYSPELVLHHVVRWSLSNAQQLRVNGEKAEAIRYIKLAKLVFRARGFAVGM